MKVKKYIQFINESSDYLLKVKDFISIPKELNDIFDICKNEVDLSNGDLLIIGFYSKILFDCLMQNKNLTYGEVDIISEVRNNIVKSNDEKEVKLQYNKITKPTHILPAYLLKMLNQYKEINFIDEKLNKYFFDIITNLIKEKLTNTSSNYSITFKKKLLNSKIKVS